jgi:hypothetical protein
MPLSACICAGEIWNFWIRRDMDAGRLGLGILLGIILEFVRTLRGVDGLCCN